MKLYATERKRAKMNYHEFIKKMSIDELVLIFFYWLEPFLEKMDEAGKAEVKANIKKFLESEVKERGAKPKNEN